MLKNTNFDTSASNFPTGLSLRANFSWTFVGNVVYAGSQWGMLVVLAKIGSPEMVGQFALGLAVTAPIIMFTNLQLRSVQVTDARGEYLFADYLELRVVTTILALLIITGIVYVSGYRQEISLVILGIGLAKAIESLSDVFHGLLQQRERMDRIAYSMMIKGPLSLAALGIGMYLTNSVVWGVVGLVIAWTMVLIGWDFRNATSILKLNLQSIGSVSGQCDQVTKLRIRLQTHILTRLVWLALPLGIVMMLISLNTNIPRYFIQSFLGERELGIFAAIAYLQTAGAIVTNSLGQAASSRLARQYADGNIRAFRKLLLRLVGIGGLLGVVGILIALTIGQELLTLIYQPEYARHELFVWLMLATGISYVASFLGYGITAARYFRIQVPLYALTTGTTILVCFWLVPSLAALGAAIALVISAAIQSGVSLIIISCALRTIHGQEREARG